MTGGVLMVPLTLFSIVAVAICLNRLWALAEERVTPIMLQRAIAEDYSVEQLVRIKGDSPLHAVVRNVVPNLTKGKDSAMESLEDLLVVEIHRLEKYLTTLGSVAAIAPLLGLLGTVIGMIDVFESLNFSGSRDPEVFSGGIAKALLTTAIGLSIAIPSLILHRHFVRKVDAFAIVLEREGKRLINHNIGAGA